VAQYEHPYPHPDVAAQHPFVPLNFVRHTEFDMLTRANAFHDELAQRRSVRTLSAEPVPRTLIESAIMSASTAPSGAHQQPWTFVAVSSLPVKQRIREAAEAEERTNYEGGRMSGEWQRELAPLGTDWHKEFLEFAPWIVVLFEQRYGYRVDGSKRHHYYVKESCGIAAGMFITALHHMGLATLTHTPSPMMFLAKLLGRPESERPSMLFPIGFPTDDCLVPDLGRKPIEAIAHFIE
jgi:iodotyrosine deiodinase